MQRNSAGAGPVKQVAGGGMRKLVEVKNMFSLNVMKFSQMYSYVKIDRLCTLNMCSLLHVGFMSEP